ncbi:MAG: GHKL domain-containing protein [Bacteroidales bacterium]|nr:GHKL domain-containing protein [Bacteroidales bacterium]
MEQDLAIKRKIFRFAVLFILFFAAAAFIQVFFRDTGSRPGKLTERSEKVLQTKENKLRSVLNELPYGDSDSSIPEFNEIHRTIPENMWTDDGILILVYHDDSLIYWSDNNFPAESKFPGNLFNKSFIQYGNGWFRVISAENNNINAVGLILVKSDYPYQNEYLVNAFQEDFKIPETTTLDTVPGRNNIHAADGQFLFSIWIPPGTGNNRSAELLAFLFFTLALVFLIAVLFYLYLAFDFFRKRPFLFLLAFVFDVFLLRFLILYFEIPRFIYQSDLFGPYLYASSIISPSLGDLFINSAIFLTLAWIFYDKFNFSIDGHGRVGRKITGLVLMLFQGILFYFLVSAIRRMVIDSSIELNLNNIFNIDIYSGIGFMAMTSMIMAFFLVTAKLCGMICKSECNPWQFAAMALFTSLLTIPLFSTGSSHAYPLVYPAVLMIYFMSFLTFNNKKAGYRNIQGALTYIVLFALISTFILDYYHHEKEKGRRKILAAELSSKRDPLMEHEFLKMYDNIMADAELKKLLDIRLTEPGTDEIIINYLNKTYFYSVWNKYEFFVTICRPEEILNIQPAGFLTNCFEYFQDRTASPLSEKISSGIYFLNNIAQNNNYLALFDFEAGENSIVPTRIYVELFYKYVSETGLGYPDLLIDSKVRIISGLSDYSYARYVNDRLIYKYGDFFYKLAFDDYSHGPGQSYFIDIKGYNHFVTHIDEYNKLIISKKSLTFLDLIAPFSYLFIFFGLYTLLMVMLLILYGKFRKVEINFSNQLQISIIGIIIVAFVVLGLITRSNIIHLYNNKNRDYLNEKTFSVLTELEHKIGNEPEITGEMHGYLYELLYKFSLIFFTDINLFDPSGNLISSSRPQIFEEELISRKMHTQAFYKLAYDQSLLYIQNEKIGRQEYLSAYIPFRNNRDQIIAYLNLPYFAKQTELRKEIADFLAAYINVYVLLIVLSVMIAIVVSRLVTRPLQLIREKMGHVGLGKINEKIAWRRRDEIGSLVDEYNRMIDELARSAELLAMSEREGAWREMARQVAHEIKNPLTPMKLSVQYLRKAWKEKTPDWEKRMENFTRTIIEQIDALSEIASEFSDFAKMPLATLEKIELAGIAKNAAELYHHLDNIHITIEHSGLPHFVMADRRQMLRVFNNLIQNAMEAIGNEKEGFIRIDITRDDGYHLVTVTDNGSGITAEQAQKIFTPSFTTKTSGMGLGLAMTRSILTSIGGTITFTSVPGEGTTFTLILPEYRGE